MFPILPGESLAPCRPLPTARPRRYRDIPSMRWWGRLWPLSARWCVKITEPMWTDVQHQHGSTRLAGQAAADDLPDTAHITLRNTGLDPAPDPATMVAECDCTSRTRPCAHILAVYYETARRLDESPRLAPGEQGRRRAGRGVF